MNQERIETINGFSIVFDSEGKRAFLTVESEDEPIVTIELNRKHELALYSLLENHLLGD